VTIETLLKTQRKNMNLTQAQVAKKLNISERAYQNYETGRRTPKLYTALLIAKVLNSTVEELFSLPASPNAGEDKPDDSQENK